MEAALEPPRLAVKDQLAQAPSAPKHALAFQLKTSVKTFLAAVVHKAPRDSPQVTASVIPKSSPVLGTEVSRREGNWGPAAAPENPSLTPAPQARSVDAVEQIPSIVFSEPGESSVTTNNSLLTKGTQATSNTSVDLQMPLTCIQGYWLSNEMPCKELQLLWEHRIERRFAMELHAHIHTGGWVLEFCILGRTQTNLKPYIVVTCVEKQTKKEIEKLVKSLSWLREIMKRHEIALITFRETTRLSANFAIAQSSPTIRVSQSITTYCGSHLEAETLASHRSISCTIGGLISVKGKVYALTAGHAFMDDSIPTELLGDDNDDQGTDPPLSLSSSLKNDSFSPPVVLDADGEMIESSNHSSVCSEQSPSHQAVESTLPSKLLVPLDWVSILRSPVFRPIARESPPKLSSTQVDWAVVELGPNQAVLPNEQHDNNSYLNHIVDIPAEMQEVSILVAGDAVSGILNPVSATLCLNSQILQPVYRICLRDCLPNGSSGAWVVMDGRVCGQIVAMREGTPFAYIQPIRLILEDIGTQLGNQGVELLSSSQAISSKRKWSESMALANTLNAESSSLTRLADRDNRIEYLSTLDTNQRLGVEEPHNRLTSADTARPTPLPESKVDLNHPSASSEPKRKGSRHTGPYAISQSPFATHIFKKRQRKWNDLEAQLPTRSSIEPSTAQPQVKDTRTIGEIFSSSLRLARLPLALRPSMPYYLELFVIRHEFRKRMLREAEQDPLDDLSNFENLSSKVFLFFRFSIAGTLDQELIMTNYTWRRIFGGPITCFILTYPLLATFAIFYYILCMPAHWWVKNKYRDLLDTREQTIARRRRAVEMLGCHTHEITNDIELRELGLSKRLYGRAGSPEQYNRYGSSKAREPDEFFGIHDRV